MRRFVMGRKRDAASGPPDGQASDARDAQPVDEVLDAPEGEPAEGTEPREMVHGALPRTMPEPEAEEAKAAAEGWRSSRRASKSGKRARRQAKVKETKDAVSEGAAKTLDMTVRILKGIAIGILVLAVTVVALWGAALGINALARWNLKRLAQQNAASTLADAAKDNLLVIGVEGGRATGFLAIEADRDTKRVLGLAIPDGAFMEVPGQGFERLGDSYVTGPDVSKDAVSNYLYVPFRRYLVVSSDVYQALLKKQQVAGILDRAQATDLTGAERSELAKYLASVPAKDVWIASLPVKPISVGDQSYFEPQRAEIADLLLSWWNVKVNERQQGVRVIVYNGVGTPGIAGKAAQQLIRQGFQVVESRNADNFDYKTTQILLYHGTQADARRVRDALGVGEIKVEPVPQEVTDIIVIIGSDYVAAIGGG